MFYFNFWYASKNLYKIYVDVLHIFLTALRNSCCHSFDFHESSSYLDCIKVGVRYRRSCVLLSYYDITRLLMLWISRVECISLTIRYYDLSKSSIWHSGCRLPNYDSSVCDWIFRDSIKPLILQWKVKSNQKQQHFKINC